MWVTLKLILKIALFKGMFSEEIIVICVSLIEQGTGAIKIFMLVIVLKIFIGFLFFQGFYWFSSMLPPGYCSRYWKVFYIWYCG